ncbi:ISAs1 family transposase [Arthrobacter sp. TMN-50]
MQSSLTTTAERHCAALTVAKNTPPITTEELPSLRRALDSLADYRHKRGVRYPFVDLLLIMVCAMFSGNTSLTSIAEWAAHASGHCPLFATAKTPSLSTLHRLAVHVDPAALDKILHTWVRTRRPAGTPLVLAVDGKEARGAKNGGQPRVFLMAAMEHASGLVVGQESIREKTNEIPHLKPLLEQVGDLDGAVVTADALHTQRAHAELLHERGAHYVLTVKGNQKALLNRIKSQTWSTREAGYSEWEKAHGRTTHWSATAQPAQDWIDLPHAAQTVMLTRDKTNHQTGERTAERVYLVTSLRPEEAGAAELAAYIRGHWGIENRLHWVRDSSMGEDRSQIRTGNAPHVMASLRNLVLALHRLAGNQGIAKAMRNAGRDPQIARNLTGL